MKRTSNVLQFVQLAADSSTPGRAGRADAIRAVGEAIGTAIRGGFHFDKTDYATLVKRFDWSCQAAVVFGADRHGHHRMAVEHGNDTAATSIESHYMRKAMYGLDRKGIRRRLCKRANFVVNNIEWTVTRLPWDFPNDAQKIGAVTYRWDEATKGNVVAKKAVFTQDELITKQAEPTDPEDSK
jgi:hypothetical protein